MRFMTLATSVLLAGLAACNTSTEPAAPAAAVSARDLVGLWVSDDYECPNGTTHTEQVRIEHTATGELVAVKVTGDDCVNAGEVTWKGRLKGDVIEGQMQGGNPSGARSWADATLRVESRDRLVLATIGKEVANQPLTYDRAPSGPGTTAGSD